MNFFKFRNPNHPLLMEQGELINHIDSSVWIERYRDPGEFSFTSEVGSRLELYLPKGTFISHQDSHELMIVEDHQIKVSKDQESTVTVTGRSYETFLDNRAVGSNVAFPTTGALSEYILAEGFSGDQALTLLLDHLDPAFLVDDDNSLPHFEILSTAFSEGEAEAERTINRGSLYKRVIELLELDNLGIKTIRPGSWSPASNPQNSVFEIHRGNDVSDAVIFTYDQAALEEIEYLYSDKKYKNVAYVYGRWVDTIAFWSNFAAPAHNDRRTLTVDASDIDNSYNEAPSGATRTAIVNKMQARGREALAAQNKISIMQPTIAKTENQAEFRRDYDLGDIVTVAGEAQYNQLDKLRITEYTEVEDKTGYWGYPTLSKVDPVEETIDE